jgi:hypothetical protein
LKYLDKSFTVPVGDGGNYEKIFGHSGPKPTQLVDGHKNPTKLSSWQKNSLYKKAKQIRAELGDILCTREECRVPNERNVRKMILSEFKHKKKVEEYRNCMTAIGADPKERSTERLRR